MNTLTFHPIIHGAWLAAVSLVMLVAMLLIEWRRTTRWRPARLLACVAVTVGLLGIGSRPHTRQTTDATGILLTPNYTTAQVDSVLQAHPQATSWHLTGTPSYKGSIPCESYRMLPSGVRSLIVIGDGLPAYTQPYLPPVVFVPGPMPAGIVSIEQKQLPANRVNTLHGMFHNDGGTKWVVLEGPGGKEDSVRINNKGDQPFTLRLRTKSPGRLVYTVRVYADAELLTADPLPVQITPATTHRIFFRLSYPTAEARFLKNMLADQGHALTLRYQVTTNTYRDEFINTSPTPIGSSSSWLSNQDLVITDLYTLEHLSAQEQRQWNDAIRQGLGLVILADAASTQKLAWTQLAFSSNRTDTTSVMLESQRISVTQPVSLTADQSVQSLAINALGKPVTGYRFHGSGKIGFQLAQNTYTWMLKSKPDVYAAYWIPLIEAVMRTPEASSMVEVTTPFPVSTHDPVDVTLVTTQETPRIQADSLSVALAENLWLDGLWSGKTWFSSPGWHTFTTSDEGTEYVYVHASGTWNALRIAQQHDFLRRQAASFTSPEHASLPEVVTPVDSRWFYLLFLVGFALLWLVPKL